MVAFFFSAVSLRQHEDGITVRGNLVRQVLSRLSSFIDVFLEKSDYYHSCHDRRKWKLKRYDDHKKRVLLVVFSSCCPFENSLVLWPHGRLITFLCGAPIKLTSCWKPWKRSHHSLLILVEEDSWKVKIFILFAVLIFSRCRSLLLVQTQHFIAIIEPFCIILNFLWWKCT